MLSGSKEKAQWRVTPLRRLELRQSSEEELSSKLERARIVRTRDLAEVAAWQSKAQPVELRMVEGVVGFNAKLEPRRLVFPKSKGFEQAEVPVGQPRSADAVSARAAEAIIGAASPRSDRSTVGTGVEPFLLRLRSTGAPRQIGTVGRSSAQTQRVRSTPGDVCGRPVSSVVTPEMTQPPSALRSAMLLACMKNGML